jgi:hypothetical protein
MKRREHEPEADAVDALGNHVRTYVDPATESLQHVRRAALAGGRAVAVLRHPAARPGGDEGGGGGHVEGWTAASGPRGVDQVIAGIDLDR